MLSKNLGLAGVAGVEYTVRFKKEIKMRIGIVALSTLLLTTTLSAQTNNAGYAIESAITTNGNIGAGITRYSDTTEIGVSFSGLIINTHHNTKLFVPVLFGGFRKQIAEQTYLAYGLDLASKFGKDTGATIKSDYFIGPYVSIEHQLTPNVLFLAWLDPYSFEYERVGCVSSSTHRFLGSGGIGVSYFFTG